MKKIIVISLIVLIGLSGCSGWRNSTGLLATS